MQSPLSHYAVLAKRWIWLVILGIVICGGVTYVVSKLIHPVYQASVTLIISEGSSSSAYDNLQASELAAPTYAQLLTSPKVLRPVLALHQGLTLNQLNAMVTAKPQPNTSLIELDVDNGNPDLAAQLANEISQSFANYANTQLPATVQILPAERPINPIRPKPLEYAGIGALVGLGLALSLIVLFEWMDDRLARPEEVQEILGMETLTTLPKLSRRQRMKQAEELPVVAEAYRVLCANLNTAEAVKPFKLVMVTSALPGEGKSTIAANLASFLARTGKRVLLVDADLRHPTLDQYFQLTNRQGLSNVLLEMGLQLSAKPNIQETDLPMLYVLTAGTLPPNPTELLQSPWVNQLFEYFKKAPFDYIIFDTLPLLPVADARILASHIETTVLVADASETPRNVVLQAKSMLNKTHTTLLGIAINKSRWPDYSGNRKYLRGIQQSKMSISMNRNPNTPPVDNTEDITADTTIVLPRPQKAKGETL